MDKWLTNSFDLGNFELAYAKYPGLYFSDKNSNNPEAVTFPCLPCTFFIRPMSEEKHRRVEYFRRGFEKLELIWDFFHKIFFTDEVIFISDRSLNLHNRHY